MMVIVKGMIKNVMKQMMIMMMMMIIMMMMMKMMMMLMMVMMILMMMMMMMTMMMMMMMMSRSTISAGKGAAAKKGDTVKMAYKGTLDSGKVFDHSSSFETKIGVGQVIPCWDSQVVGMQVGEHATLSCPSGTAYGSKGTSGIPGGSHLTFDVTLKGIS